MSKKILSVVFLFLMLPHFLAINGCAVSTEKTVYVASSGNGECYHYSKFCSNMKNPYKTTILKAVQGNYRPCSKCADYSDYSEIPKTKPSANSSTNRKEQTATPIHRFTFIFGLTLAGVFKYRHNKKIEQYEREKQNEL